MLDKFFHETLRLPYRLHVAHDRHVSDEKVTLVFWHGIGATSKVWNWNKVIDTISNNHSFDHARLVTFDLLGFGKSPAPSWLDYTTDDHLRSLHHTLRKLRIKTPVILIGHSMGSLLAVEYVATYPKEKISALMLASPPFLQHAKSKTLFDRLYRKIYNKLLTAIQIQQLDTVVDSFEKFTSFEPDTANQEAFQRSIQHVVINSRAFDQMKKLRLPIHIFHGSLDFLVNGGNLKAFANQKNVVIHTTPSGHDIVGLKRNQLIETLAKLVRK
ncbi:MAG: alpha/beta fold hydrolase [Candidatus Nomurabacteria bacterium]|jgi:pimeloyl-ACP methyl ester carboxylesterase|nr:alpha/beta fold hydrolase [Candidatus Nomurabacteria bacterium]